MPLLEKVGQLQFYVLYSNHTVLSGNYKLVLGDAGPPDIWSVPVKMSSPSIINHPILTTWNTTVQLFDVVKDIREESDISADNQAVVSSLAGKT